jgi:phosphatidate cytidylyltransferase
MLPDATPGAFAAWSLLGAGTLYLGLPVYAAIALRSLPGAIQAGWLTDLAGRLSLGWDTAPRGLAWALTVILAIWVADSAAYLVGRALGQRKLAPKISPNKTIEGSLGGLAGAMLVCTVAFSGFGIGAWWHGLLIGAAIGICGQLGDLS